MSPHDEALLRTLFDDSPVGVMVCDSELRVLDCNKPLLDMASATREQVIGMDLRKLRPSGVLSALEAALRGEKGSYTGPQETTLAVPPRTMALSARTSPFYDASGKVSGVVLMVVDLTALHDAKLKEQEGERRYRELVELSPEPIFVHAGGRFLYANAALLRAFAVDSLPDLLRRSAADFIHPEQARHVDARVAQVQGGRPTGFESQRFLRADGTSGYAEVASIPLVYDGHQAVLTVARDVSKRKEAEQATQALERRVRAQFKAIPVPTYAWQRQAGTDEFVLVDFNDPALELSEGGLDKLLGATLTELHGGDEQVRRDMLACLADGVTIQRDRDHTLRTTGRKLRFSITYVGVPPDLVLGFAENVTARARLEDELRQAKKMEAIGRLAGGVAHDFNNLLTVIGGFADTVQRTFEPGDPRADEMAEIVKAADRGGALTRQLLTLSRKQIVTRENVVLDDLVAALEPMLRRLIGEDVEIVVVAGAAGACVNADPRQIEQLVLNLAVNARDAMPNGGTLTLETARLPDGITLSVRDTGHGMDAETRAHAFDPFFTTKGAGHGTGLGLSTVYATVQQSRGTIDVTSAPGLGSTFLVRFPPSHVDGTDPKAVAPKVTAPGADQGTVLLVEDDSGVRRALQRMLEHGGYKVYLADSGAAALALAPSIEGAIDLVVTDVVMPGLSGPEMFAALSVIRPGLHVLYVSGYNDEDIFRRGTMPPGVAFLQKPFTVDALLERVGDLIGRR